VVAAGSALAKDIDGGKRGEKLTGTKHADTIKGRDGNDTVKGKGGNDRLDGGGGSDTVVGGKGADIQLGDRGNDTLKAGDGRRDKKIFAASGNDVCDIDTTLELAATRSCETITNAGGFADRGPGPGQGLRVGIAEGLGCTPQKASCSFSIQGDGADALGGNVTGVGGVGSVSGVTLAVVPPENDDWISTGGYRCSGPGALRVTIGAESVEVPVSCG
jgi:Ca2+-binding RTX toxin-like protein